MSNQLERQIFEALKRNYDAIGVDCAIWEPSDDIPLETMVTVFEGIGENERSFRLESNFFPRPKEREEALLLQSLTVLMDKVIPYHQPELLRLLVAINYTLPIGAFGFLESAQMVYFKHNAMLMVQPDLEQYVRQIDAQNGLIFHVHHIYFDAIEAVATGKSNTEEALALVARIQAKQ